MALPKTSPALPALTLAILAADGRELREAMFPSAKTAGDALKALGAKRHGRSRVFDVEYAGRTMTVQIHKMGHNAFRVWRIDQLQAFWAETVSESVLSDYSEGRAVIEYIG